jgi:hypothetical protein
MERARRRAASGAWFPALVLLIGWAVAAPASVAAPKPHDGRWQIGLRDSGKTIHVSPGDHIVVRLPGGASGGFHRPRSSSPAKVRRTTAHGGYPSKHRAVARFVAVEPGMAELSATDDYTCLHATPPCLPPQRQWRVHLEVTTAGRASSARVRPGQSFVGLVNGSDKSPKVSVVCPGPAGGARRGPPVSKQTLAIAPSPALSGPGFTGSAAQRVVAVFAADPSVRVRLRAYHHPKPIPTRLRLPCEGTGVVRFVPHPKSSSAHRDRVVVNFVNIAD